MNQTAQIRSTDRPADRGSDHSTKNPDLHDVMAHMAALQADVAYLVARQQKQAELLEEAMPILKAMISTATARFAELEQKGYFAFGTELLGVLDQVVGGFSPDDVRALGNNVVRILQTVRELTQPEMLAVADELTEAIDEGQNDKPVGLMGALKATRDDDVKQGLAVAVSVLRHLGRASRSIDERTRLARRGAHEKKDTHEKLSALLAPRRRPAAEDAPAPSPRVAAPRAVAVAAAVPAAAPPAGGTVEFGGVAWTADGFLVDPKSWSRELAEAVAKSQGIAELTPEHWKVIAFCREKYEASGASPNVRAMAVGADVTTKDLYQLFPPAPGKVAARIAGVPKPVGCI